MELAATATALAGFLFTKMAETVIAKATEAVLPKINRLRQIVWDKLQGIPQVEAEIEKTEQQDEKPDLEVIADYLKIAMREDQQFANEVQDLINDINQELENEDQGKNLMYVFGGKAFQQNQNQGTINNADTIKIYYDKKTDL